MIEKEGWVSAEPPHFLLKETWQLTATQRILRMWMHDCCIMQVGTSVSSRAALKA